VDLTAIFETWTIGDRTYPQLRTGMHVNLSFEMLMDRLAETEPSTPQKFEHLGRAEYDCVGTIIRNYSQGTQHVVVAQADGFRFYTVSTKAEDLTSGRRFRARGRLVLDHYIWVEYLSSYADPPDLFYQLRVDRINRVTVPESFVKRGNRSLSAPTSLRSSEYSQAAISQVNVIEDDSFTFYLVDFTDRDVPAIEIPRTYLG
jgi:hypothetical protein